MAYTNHLTIAQYRTLTGLPLVGVNDLYVDFKLKTWSKQIDKLTTQNWSTQTSSDFTVDVQSCGEYLFKFQAMEKAGLQISVRHKRQTNWIPLTEHTDYKLLRPDFDTVVADEIIASQPIIGLDFRCYRCNCECQEFKITGEKFWHNGIADDLQSILIDLVENLLKVDNQAYTGGIIPIQNALNDVKRESDQTRSVEWNIDTDKIAKINEKLRLGVNAPEYWNIIEPYALASMNLYRRFKA
jgi:hypothetical protein